MLEKIVFSFVTFLVILDPVGVAVIFAGLAHDMPADVRRHTAWRATIIASVLVLAFAVVGEPLMRALGISVPAFRIAGGILLFLLATDMVFARPSGIRNPTGPEQAEAAQTRDISVFPLAFPLLAGPGALTSVVLLIGRAPDMATTAGIIASLLAVLGLTLGALLLADRVAKLLGLTGANVVGRVLGVLLAALATQYVVDGVTELIQR